MTVDDQLTSEFAPGNPSHRHLPEPPAQPGADMLERLLGDPNGPGVAGFAAAVARDERDEFPDELCQLLRGTGFHLNYLPRSAGGTLDSFDASLTLVRTAARRDLNVMPGTMFSINAGTCVLLHGNQQQRRWLIGLLRHGGSVSFALSEFPHGSDLLANTACARRDDNGWRLDGRKWMVGLGHRCEAVYLVARTSDRGPGAFTGFLVERSTLPTDRFRVGSPLTTSGMRGIDFAEYGFTDCPVPADAVVGPVNGALEAVARAQQVVRVMSMAGSLGCADTALRLTLDVAARHRVGRTVVLDSLWPRRELAVAAAALLVTDLVALTAARGLHTDPAAFSVWGHAAKHVAAEVTEDLMRRCATVLSARSVLRCAGPGAGVFQKLRRDVDVIRVVETSPLANLRSFAGQLPSLLASAPGRGRGDASGAAFQLDAPLPEYQPARLELTARSGTPVTGGFVSLSARASAALADAGAFEVAALVRRTSRELERLGERVQSVRRPREAAALAQIDAAERFSYLHAAMCCVAIWWGNRHLSLYGAPPGCAGWLGAVLSYLLARADGIDPRRDAVRLEPALRAVEGLRRRNRLFSAVPVRLAGSHDESPKQPVIPLSEADGGRRDLPAEGRR